MVSTSSRSTASPNMVASEIMDDDEAENTSAVGEQPSTATDLAEGAKGEASAAGEQSSTATDPAEGAKGEPAAVPPPATKPSPDDIPSDTPTSTASS